MARWTAVEPGENRSSARHLGVCWKAIDLEPSQHVGIVGRSQRKCRLRVVRIGGSLQHKACRGDIAVGT